MSGNTFGRYFKMTTWGESHGLSMGCVIDGCPAGLSLYRKDIQKVLDRRRPGGNPWVTARNEPDQVEIHSGVFEDKTTGMPIALVIKNKDVQSKYYDPLLLRPGHASYSYLKKYGHYDYRGGGRASGRETLSRVAAGAVASVFLAQHGIACYAYIHQLGPHMMEDAYITDEAILKEAQKDPIGAPDSVLNLKIRSYLEQKMKEGNSCGVCVRFVALHVPPGLGNPVFDKLDASLAGALMGIPAVKSVSIGSGHQCHTMHGSTHNDVFYMDQNQVATKTNHAGGVLGGISHGMPICGEVHFKPTSSIYQPQKTINIHGDDAVLHFKKDARHDPCVGLRGRVVIEAMVSCVLADMLLMTRCDRMMEQEDLCMQIED